MIPHDLLRLVDANLDRASEGLRVAEDLVRFLLDNEAAAAGLRVMRHRLWRAASGIPGVPGRLLDARDSGADVGRAAPAMKHAADSAQLFRTNLHRVQEACRTLEESGQGIGLDSVEISRIRFEAYDVEKSLYPAFRGRDLGRKLDFSLCVVIDLGFSRGRSEVEIARAAIEGGAGAIRLRGKDLPSRELVAVARDLRALTAEGDVTFVVDDRADAALAVGADGVHLGHDGLPLRDTRRITGPDTILGASARSLDEAREAEGEGADYVSIGPVFAMAAEPDAGEPVGTGLITEAVRVLQCPLICFGGINLSNVDRVVMAGSNRVAVASAVAADDDVSQAVRELVDRIGEVRAKREQARSGEEKHNAMVP